MQSKQLSLYEKQLFTILLDDLAVDHSNKNNQLAV